MQNCSALPNYVFKNKCPFLDRFAEAVVTHCWSYTKGKNLIRSPSHGRLAKSSQAYKLWTSITWNLPHLLNQNPYIDNAGPTTNTDFGTTCFPHGSLQHPPRSRPLGCTAQSHQWASVPLLKCQRRMQPCLLVFNTHRERPSAGVRLPTVWTVLSTESLQFLGSNLMGVTGGQIQVQEVEMFSKRKVVWVRTEREFDRNMQR